MPAKKKKDQEVVVKEPEVPQQTITTEINFSELFEKLREFDNKVLLERLQVLERSITLLYKEQLNNRIILNEIRQNVSYLAIAQEELLSNMGLSLESVNDESEDKEQENENSDKTDDKKWN